MEFTYSFSASFHLLCCFCCCRYQRNPRRARCMQIYRSAAWQDLWFYCDRLVEFQFKIFNFLFCIFAAMRWPLSSAMWSWVLRHFAIQCVEWRWRTQMVEKNVLGFERSPTRHFYSPLYITSYPHSRRKNSVRIGRIIIMSKCVIPFGSLKLVFLFLTDSLWINPNGEKKKEFCGSTAEEQSRRRRWKNLSNKRLSKPDEGAKKYS